MSLPTDYYAGRHRTQYDGSPLAKQNCAPTTAANGSRAASGGRIDKSGGDVRALVAQSEETSPATPGWSLEDQALACRRLGVAFAITGGGWVALQAAHDAGRFVSVPGDSDQFGDGTCSGAFDGDHSVGIHPGTAADGTWPLADPICPARRQEKPSVIRAYAEKLGGAGFRFGVFTDEVPKEDEVIKAIRLAHLLGIRHVITTESEPRTEFGRGLTPEEQVFLIREKLHTPILWAEELGVELLLETHGPVTDSVDRMAALLDALGHEETVGVCLDTGNSWLGGAEPIDYVRRFGKRIKHVHWKDIGPEWQSKRGTVFGCGMATIPLGDGVIDLEAIIAALKEAGFDQATTLEVAGADNVRLSAQRLKEWCGRCLGSG